MAIGWILTPVSETSVGNTPPQQPTRSVGLGVPERIAGSEPVWRRYLVGNLRFARIVLRASLSGPRCRTRYRTKSCLTTS
jgi:hypothetical protein